MTAANSSDTEGPRVFLSYARADRPRVAKLAEALKQSGLEVWWDAAIETGSRFSADIERELHASDAVVVAWSAASVASAWVLDEAATGRDRGRLVPVLLDGTPPPLGFRQFQTTDLSDWKGRVADARIAALAALVRKLADAPVEAPGAVVPAGRGYSRRALMGGGAAVVLVGAGTFGAWRWRGGMADEVGPATLAVLPFANLSGDPTQAYFSDGLAEELRLALAQIPGLLVISRASSEKFRDQADPTRVAAELGVSHILTGSVRRSPTTVRITAQLVDAGTGKESWSAAYNRPIGDTLDIQSSIATAVVGAVNKRIGAVAQQVRVGGTDSAEAQALYLEAASFEDGTINETLYRKKIAQLDRVIALDPGYADAFRVKGILLSEVANLQTSLETAQPYHAQALASVARAAAIAPESPWILASYAMFLVYNLDLRKGLATAEKALRIASANRALASPAVPRAINLVDPQRALDIINPYLAFDALDGFAFGVRSEILLNLRRFEEAAADSRKALDLSNGYRGTQGLHRSLLMLDRTEEARALKQRNGRRLALNQALLEARSGNGERAHKLLQTGWDPRLTGYGRALVHAQLREVRPALDALDMAVANTDPDVIAIAFDPFLDPLRGEPRFRAVQDRIIPPDLLVSKRPRGT